MKNRVLIIVSVGIVMFGLFAFQNERKEESVLSKEEAIEAVLETKINDLQLEYARDCKQRALKKAVIIADSLIAEMFAQDLRAKDQILERPEKPEMPEVEITPFPFDSIE